MSEQSDQSPLESRPGEPADDQDPSSAVPTADQADRPDPDGLSETQDLQGTEIDDLEDQPISTDNMVTDQADRPDPDEVSETQDLQGTEIDDSEDQPISTDNMVTDQADRPDPDEVSETQDLQGTEIDDSEDQPISTDNMVADQADRPDPDEVSEIQDLQGTEMDDSEDQPISTDNMVTEGMGPEDVDSEGLSSRELAFEGMDSGDNQDTLPVRKTVRRHLGRGLSALLGDDEQDYADLDKLKSSKTVPVEFLFPGRFQPRRKFDKSEIESLAQSVKSRGVLQPILARRHSEKVNNYEIIAGERRWRAAQMAGLHEVPVLVRDLDDGAALEIALVENLQRQNLNAIEEAAGYQRLMDEFNHTQQALSKAIGRSRSHIANTVRLLKLPETVQGMIQSGALTAGHARAIATAPEPQKLAQKIVDKNLNVRQAELLAQQVRDRQKNRQDKQQKQGSKGKLSNQQPGKSKNTDTVALENEVSEALGLRVSIDHRVSGSGLVTVNYSSLEQLEMLLARLSYPTSHNDEGLDSQESVDPREITETAGSGRSKEATFSVETDSTSGQGASGENQ